MPLQPSAAMATAAADRGQTRRSGIPADVARTIRQLATAGNIQSALVTATDREITGESTGCTPGQH